MKLSFKGLTNKLRKSFRLVILHEDNFEEKAQMKLNMLNGLTVVSLSALAIVVATVCIMAFTPIRQFIPGYTDPKLRRDLQEMYLKTQLLENEIKNRDVMVKGALSIHEPATKMAVTPEDKRSFNANYDTIAKTFPKLTEAEKKIQNYIEKEVYYDLDANKLVGQNETAKMSQLVCFKPVQGSVTRNFDFDKGQLGVDILAKENEPIKAILDGTVILSTWTTEGGYIIGIQHKNNLVSFCKHNSALLHKVGSFVKAGDVIAIVGKSGSNSKNPTLYFELWQDGKAVNPEKFVRF